MSNRQVAILLNERPHSVPEGTTVGNLRDTVKPGADVLVVNGFPCRPEIVLDEGDRVVLIRRGEIPDASELEALMVARHTPNVHSRMKQARVGIAGLGGLGSAVAIALARMGVGKLVIADFDVVEPTNLNRQQYAVAHVGMTKTEAMSSILEDINPYLEIVAHRVVLERDNVPEIFQGVDVVLECFDRAKAKAMLIQSVAELLPDTYVVGASGLAGYGESNTIRTMQLGERIFMVGDLTTAAEPGRGLMAPRVGIAAHHQANVVVSLLVDPEHVKL
jgi:sulfur carrier protein ThiS adenylyltransferase